MVSILVLDEMSILISLLLDNELYLLDLLSIRGLVYDTPL
jgi:hypothetical protein